MPGLSSIFSFDTLDRRGGSAAVTVKWTILWTALLLGLAHVFVFPRLRAMAISDDVARVMVLPTGPATVMVSGTSRNGLGVHPQTLAARLGCPVEKMPIPASTAWEVGRLLQRQPELFSGMKVLIIDIEPYQFNSNSPAIFGGWRNFRRLSRLDEKFARRRLRGRREALHDVVCANRWTFDELLHLATGRIGGEYPRMDDRWGEFADKIPSAEALAGEEMASGHMASYEPFEFTENALFELVDICRRKGAALIVNVPPATRTYIQLCRDRYPEAYDHFLGVVDKLRRQAGVDVVFCETFDGISTSASASVSAETDPTLFLGYGHMSLVGAKLYTAWLADRLGELEAVRMALGEQPDPRRTADSETAAYGAGR